MTRRWGAPAALAMAAALLGAGPAVAKIGSCDAPILLGTTISETGPFSTLTDNWKKMTEIFFEEVNNAGGIYVEACKKKLPVKILIYDDQSSPSTATSLFEKMASVDNVDFFVGPDWTSLGLPVPTVAERHQIPIVTANVATPSAYQRGLKYMWGTPYPVVPLWSQRYFEMLTKVEPKPKTIFFVTHDNPVMKGITDYWAPKAEEQGIKIVGRELFPADAKDFSAIILKIRAAKPDIVYIASFDNVSAPLVQQMRQQRVKAMDVHHTMLTGALARQVGQDIEGMTGELAWYPDVGGPHSELVKKVLERSKVDMFESIFTMGRIASYLVMVQAIERAGAVDREKVREVLTKGTFEAPPGPVVFNENGFPTTNGAFTIQIQNGKVAVVWPQTAAKVIWPSPTWK
ncbi:amino acid ABC transporter substrate-binding protein [Xanthobacter pseudotagetidis]|uniref:amino acid ABC transporter substrate-binding protein n=1 Tax=Xanthobacter pseudotagetidis TaxID=3119911 RepID=UPI003726645C